MSAVKARSRLTAWKYFAGASILAAGLLVKVGVPVAPIAIGIALSAFVNWKRLGSRA